MIQVFLKTWRLNQNSIMTIPDQSDDDDESRCGDADLNGDAESDECGDPGDTSSATAVSPLMDTSTNSIGSSGNTR